MNKQTNKQKIEIPCGTENGFLGIIKKIQYAQLEIYVIRIYKHLI